MWCFEELEQNFIGKLKSVLLVSLSALLLVSYGKGQAAVLGVNSAAATVMLWEKENPVDSCFQEFITDSYNEKQQYAYAVIYRECWERELIHAYELLGKRMPLPALARKQIQEAVQYFQKYARVQGELKSYFEEGQRTEKDEADSVNVLTTDSIYAETELLREQTLRIYGELLAKQEDLSSQIFVFSEKEAEKMLASNGILRHRRIQTKKYLYHSE